MTRSAPPTRLTCAPSRAASASTTRSPSSAVEPGREDPPIPTTFTACCMNSPFRVFRSGTPAARPPGAPRSPVVDLPGRSGPATAFGKPTCRSTPAVRGDPMAPFGHSDAACDNAPSPSAAPLPPGTRGARDRSIPLMGAIGDTRRPALCRALRMRGSWERRRSRTPPHAELPARTRTGSCPGTDGPHGHAAVRVPCPPRIREAHAPGRRPRRPPPRRRRSDRRGGRNPARTHRGPRSAVPAPAPGGLRPLHAAVRSASTAATNASPSSPGSRSARSTPPCSAPMSRSAGSGSRSPSPRAPWPSTAPPPSG